MLNPFTIFSIVFFGARSEAFWHRQRLCLLWQGRCSRRFFSLHVRWRIQHFCTVNFGLIFWMYRCVPQFCLTPQQSGLWSDDCGWLKCGAAWHVWAGLSRLGTRSEHWIRLTFAKCLALQESFRCMVLRHMVIRSFLACYHICNGWNGTPIWNSWNQ